jgi:protein PhnA
MWSQVPAVQVMAYRILNKLGSQDLVDMMYLEPEVLEWAKEGLETKEDIKPTRDSNGNILQEGDSVTIIKDLVVKGAGFTAKQGTTVKNIHIADSESIEGRVNGVKIVLLSKFLKKV